MRCCVVDGPLLLLLLLVAEMVEAVADVGGGDGDFFERFSGC